MLEVLQAVGTPLAIIVVSAFYYRRVSRGLDEMERARKEHRIRETQRHEEVMASFRERSKANDERRIPEEQRH